MMVKSKWVWKAVISFNFQKIVYIFQFLIHNYYYNKLSNTFWLYQHWVKYPLFQFYSHFFLTFSKLKTLYFKIFLEIPKRHEMKLPKVNIFRPACYPKRCDICREKFVGTILPTINCEATCGQCSVCERNPQAFPFCGTICTRSYSYCVATCKTDQKICLTCAGFCGLAA